MLKIYRFSPSFIALFLGGIALALVLTSIIGDIVVNLSDGNFPINIPRLFGVNKEGNIPAAFSGLLLFFAAFLLAFITMCKKQDQTNVLHWKILALGFFMLGFDELCMLHERISMKFPSAYMIGVIVLALIIATFYWKFILSLPKKTSLSFLGAAALYIGGAFVIDVIGAKYKPIIDPQGSIPQSLTSESLVFSIFTHLEESLEIAGIIVLIWALLVYIKDNYQITTINAHSRENLQKDTGVSERRKFLVD